MVAQKRGDGGGKGDLGRELGGGIGCGAVRDNGNGGENKIRERKIEKESGDKEREFYLQQDYQHHHSHHNEV